MDRGCIPARLLLAARPLVGGCHPPQGCGGWVLEPVLHQYAGVVSGRRGMQLFPVLAGVSHEDGGEVFGNPSLSLP